MQYQVPGIGYLKPWIGFNWRYDSGLVAGSVPCYNVTDPTAFATQSTAGTSVTCPMVSRHRPERLTADQEFEAGLTCDGVKATPTHPLPSLMPGVRAHLEPGQYSCARHGNDDKNPPRIQPRNLFDASIGEDNSSTVTGTDGACA